MSLVYICNHCGSGFTTMGKSKHKHPNCKKAGFSTLESPEDSMVGDLKVLKAKQNVRSSAMVMRSAIGELVLAVEFLGSSIVVVKRSEGTYKECFVPQKGLKPMLLYPVTRCAQLFAQTATYVGMAPEALSRVEDLISIPQPMKAKIAKRYQEVEEAKEKTSKKSKKKPIKKR